MQDADANFWVADFALRSGVPPSQGVTVRAAVERFVTSIASVHDRSPRTVKAYATDLAQLATHVGVDREVSGVTGPVVLAWLTELQSAGYSAASRRRKLAAARSFVRGCVELGLLKENPLRGLAVRIAAPRALPRCLTDAETTALLRVASSRASECKGTGAECSGARACRDSAVLELLLATGMRVGEMSALTLADVDMASGRVLVHGKGRRQRTAFVADVVALAALRHYLEHRQTFGVRHNRLFVGRGGRPLSTQASAAAVRGLARNAELARRITPHMLRHTAASALLRAGANLRIVQEFLGHASIVMTQRYTHVTAWQLEESLHAHNHLMRLRA